MNEFKIILTILFCTAAIASKSQAAFQRSYGGLGSDYGRTIIECSSGGYLLVGSTNSYADPSTDIYVLRIDESGDYIWGKNLGVANRIDWAEDVVEDNSGNFYIAGYTNRFSENGYDGLLVKIDSDGNELNSWTYGADDWDFITSISIDSDEMLYLSGSTTINNKEIGWIVKANLNGLIIWQSLIPSLNPTRVKGLAICDDGNLVFAGEEYIQSSDTLQFLGNISSNGDLAWIRFYGEFLNQTVGGCTCINNEHIVSTATQIIDGDNFVFNSKVQVSNGDIIWNRTDYGFRVRSNSIEVKSNGNIIFAGTQEVTANRLLDAVSYEFSPNGEFISGDLSEVQGGFGTDIFYDIEPTSDGGYICVGETNSFGNNWQVLVSKIGPNGESIQTNTDYLDITTPVQNRNPTSSLLTLYPNPSERILQVRIDPNVSTSGLNYGIVDIYGKTLQSGTFQSQIDVSDIAAGSYFFMLRDSEGQTLSQTKFLKIN